MTTADPVARVLRWVAVVVAVAGLAVLVTGVARVERTPPRPVTGPLLAESLRDGVGAAPVGNAACGRSQGDGGRVWQCSVPDREGSGGASYDLTLRDRCWRAAITSDYSEGRNMPRRAHGCVPRY